MIITASHQKGGVGKSTLIWNLAIAYSFFHKVKVIDLDMQKTFTQSYKLRCLNYKNGELPESSSVSIDNVELISLEDCPNTKEKFIEILRSVKREEIMLIDSGGFDSELNRIAILASNILLTPVSTKFFDLMGLRQYEGKLKELSKKSNKKIIATVVFNKINPNTKHVDAIIDFIKQSEYFNCLTKILRQRVDYENTPARGHGVVEIPNYIKSKLDIARAKKTKDEFIAFVNALTASVKNNV